MGIDTSFKDEDPQDKVRKLLQILCVFNNWNYVSTGSEDDYDIDSIVDDDPDFTNDYVVGPALEVKPYILNSQLTPVDISECTWGAYTAYYAKDDLDKFVDHLTIQDVFKLFDIKGLHHKNIVYYADPGPHQRDRIQAAQAYPAFAKWFSEIQPEEIDEQRPLGPLLENKFDLTKNKLKRIKTLPTEYAYETLAEGEQPETRFNIQPVDSWSKTVNKFSILTTDWIPNSLNDWKAFRLVDTNMIEPLHLILDLDWYRSVGCSKGKWADYSKTLARAVDVDPESILSRQPLIGLTNDITEFIEDFTRNFMVPCLSDNTLNRAAEPLSDMPQLMRVATDVLTFGQKNPVAGLLKHTRKWTTRRPRLESFKDTDVSVDGWYKLFDDITIDGFHCVCLYNKQQLLTEGSEMNHCVGSYSSRCLNGKTHIVSVRNNDHRATLHLTLSNNKTTGEYDIKVSQYRARSNCSPNADANIVKDELVRRIRQKELDCNWGSVTNLIENPRVNTKKNKSTSIKMKSLIQTKDSKLDKCKEEWMKFVLPGFKTRIFNMNEKFNKFDNTEKTYVQ